MVSQVKLLLSWGWGRERSKTQEFQDSFPKIQYCDSLPLMELEMEWIVYGNRNSHFVEFGRNDKQDRVMY